MFTISETPPKNPFAQAAIVISTKHSFDAPAADVFRALDSDLAWRWLAPTCGVDYLEPADNGAPRGVGMVREMGSVRRPLRWFWRQREVFTGYEANRALAYYASHGSWPLLRLWAENYRLEPTSDTSCTLRWKVAMTPTIVGRLPLHWTEPALRLAFTIGIRPGLRRLTRQLAATH
ncbi:hypothetical protein GOEFS_022_00120 [Gordonia effusa NBRC 100432]|uniref:Polyketide cyclase/dehydrase n=1 Tax=Gordonia effusa NBRC 100432 TaxID=1077974 RepID=H0QWN1_9ACTN|nr:SRPBCC family protein [Gordonia effusa]GAB17232.1 hypothetical protein GOEFS_022_00120 [Gordonia effusa NBRC 100432]